MHKIKSQLSEIIASTISTQLTSSIQYKAIKLKYERERSAKAKQRSIQYTYATVGQLQEIFNLKPEKCREDEATKYDFVENKKEHGLVKRVSLKKIRRSIFLQKKNSLQNCGGNSKKLIKTMRENHKGLIKLTLEEEDNPSLKEYIDKLRQKKIKYAQVLEQLSQQHPQNYKKLKLPTAQNKSTALINSQRMYITNFSGEIIKHDKKQQNVKKDELYIEKIKIKPLFKLKQNVTNRKDLFKTTGFNFNETRRNSMEGGMRNSSSSVKEDSYYIKSIIDVITTRKNLDNVRRRRNNMR